MKLSSPKIKGFLIFSQKKAFLIFQEAETSKKFPYISENGTLLYFRKWNPLKSLLIFQEETFPARKMKKTNT